MEQRNLLLAIALSFGIFLLWSLFFAPTTKPLPEAPTPKQVETAAPGKTEPAIKTEAPVKKEPVATENAAEPAAAAIQTPTTPTRRITVSSPLYTMTLSERGAAVVSMMLKKYRETVDPKSPYKELIPEELHEGTMRVELFGKDTKGLVGNRYVTDTKADHLEVTDQPVEVRFRSDNPSGISIIKTFRFTPKSYLVGLNVEVINGSQRNMDAKVGVVMANLLAEGGARYTFEGPSALINGSLKEIKIKKIEDHPVMEGDIRWAAIESQYFMESIVPQEAVKGQLDLSHQDDKVTQSLILDNPPLAAQQQESFKFNIFMGPKRLSLLRSFNNGLEKAINFGWFDFLAKPCLWFMNFIYKFIPNYGVAIIILTIVTRMMFWPLATKSYKSMGAMRKLQPLMQEIREKYKNDKQRMNQEMMALYRTYKINPMGGCLPMLIQLPVFFALYRMLYKAIELRHAPFIWWINDLSAPDRLFHFSFKIPFMQPPYGIPVMTLVMAATMFVQQKMTPTPGDPSQAKMMMFLPLIFLFIFINFPSGLVLYWMVSNIISIAQQYTINKKLA